MDEALDIILIPVHPYHPRLNFNFELSHFLLYPLRTVFVSWRYITVQVHLVGRYCTVQTLRPIYCVDWRSEASLTNTKFKPLSNSSHECSPLFNSDKHILWWVERSGNKAELCTDMSLRCHNNCNELHSLDWEWLCYSKQNQTISNNIYTA